MNVNADHIATLDAFAKTNNTKQLLLSDFRRQMLPAYDALVTDEKSPIFRYAKRAYFVIDKEGVIRHVHAGYKDGEEDKIGEEVKALLGK